MSQFGKNYYTATEALELLEQAFSEDQAPRMFVDACHNRALSAWVTDEETGERFDVPYDKWWGTDEIGIDQNGFRFSFGASLAMLEVGDYLDKRSILGELRVDKDAFDLLLNNASTEPKVLGRPTLRDVIRSAYDTLIKERKICPNDQRKVICREVRARAMQNLGRADDNERGLGNDTITRAISGLPSRD